MKARATSPWRIPSPPAVRHLSKANILAGKNDYGQIHCVSFGIQVASCWVGHAEVIAKFPEPKLGFRNKNAPPESTINVLTTIDISLKLCIHSSLKALSFYEVTSARIVPGIFYLLMTTEGFNYSQILNRLLQNSRWVRTKKHQKKVGHKSTWRDHRRIFKAGALTNYASNASILVMTKLAFQLRI